MLRSRPIQWLLRVKRRLRRAAAGCPLLPSIRRSLKCLPCVTEIGELRGFLVVFVLLFVCPAGAQGIDVDRLASIQRSGVCEGIAQASLIDSNQACDPGFRRARACQELCSRCYADLKVCYDDLRGKNEIIVAFNAYVTNAAEQRVPRWKIRRQTDMRAIRCWIDTFAL